MRRQPPDILITTPESLYLMLTSQAREILRRRRGGDRRRDPRRRPDQARRAPGADARAPRGAGRARASSASACRATQNPLEEVGRFLVGPRRTCRIVDTGVRKPLDLKIHVPVESMVEPEQPTALDLDPFGRAARRRAARSGRRSTRELLELVREHRSTIVFVNNRRGAERLALRLNELRARQRDRPRPPRLAGARGAARRRGDAQGGRAAVPGRDLVAGARHRHGRGRPRAPGRVAEVGRRAACSGSAAPATTSATTRKGRIFPKFRADLLECAVVAKRMREGEIEPTVVPRNPLDVLAQQIVAIAAAARRGRRRASTTCTRSSPARYTYAELSRALLENVLDMLDGRYPSRGVRRAAAADRLGPRRRHDPRAQGRARSSRSPTPARSPTAACSRVTLPDGRRVGELDEEMVYEARPGPDVPARRVDLADRGDRPRPRDRHARRRACRARCRSGRATASGGPKELGEAIGEFSRWAVDQHAEVLERDYDLDELAATQPARLPARAAGGHARRAERPDDRRRALPRRDRRLAAVRAVALRRPRPRRLGRWR